MDIYSHASPHFTWWAVANNYFKEPFVVIDIGVQGGEHSRWQHLGDKVHVYGFDAISEVIDRLKAESAGKANRHFRTIGLGDEDGRREFYVPPNTYGGSFYRGEEMVSGRQGDIALGARTVEIRRLDSLFANADIPPADYIKLDCEGFEPEVVRGARQYLARSNILCVTVETNFDVSPVYMRTPFADISDMLVEHRLTVAELNLVRTPQPAYVQARAKYPWPEPDIWKNLPDLDVGRPRTFDIVFCRDYVDEMLRPNHFTNLADSVTEPTADKIIKSMINFELHGLMDCAVALADHFRPQLSERFDVDVAIELLVRRPLEARNTADVTSCLTMIHKLRAETARRNAELIYPNNELSKSSFDLMSRVPAVLIAKHLGGRILRRLTGRAR